MKKIISIRFISIIITCIFFVVSCDDSEESICDIIKVQLNNISIVYPNNSCTPGEFDTNFNEHGQVISFSDTFTCGSKIYSVWVSNIEYESWGDIHSYDATINGENCSWEN